MTAAVEVKERPILFSAPMVRAILEGGKTQTRRIVKPQPAPEGTWDWAWPLKGKAWTPGSNVAWRNDARPTISMLRMCPFGEPGDQLWVREAWRTRKLFDGLSPAQAGARVGKDLFFEADKSQSNISGVREEFTPGRIRASIHMPRWASRITLEITGVRVERLQDISEADAKAEGLVIQIGGGTGPGSGYKWSGPGYTGIGRHPSPTFHVACMDSATCSCFARPQVNPAVCAYRELWNKINGAGSWQVNPWVWVVSFQREKPGTATAALSNHPATQPSEGRPAQ